FDLEKLLSSGQFREDLFYRLNVVPIFIPPLRDRHEDIPELVDYFADKFGIEAGRKVRFTQDAVVALAHYPWPGNVRELENVIERSVVMAGRDVIDATDLKLMPAQVKSEATQGQSPEGSLIGAIHDIELNSLREALTRTGGRQAAAARLLGISPRQIGYKIKKYGLGV
ncbi:MAG: helix-turn-helix domain-containing protein, partial [Nitrospirota bacterium]